MGLPKGPEGQDLPEVRHPLSLARRGSRGEGPALGVTDRGAEVETREDEEQNVKLTEILELLVAAGYFRARIKGLSPFDKWLVKRAIETKEEMGDYIRSYSISQFQKTYSLPEDDDFLKRKEKAIKTVVDLWDVYKPRRKYKRQEGAEELLDEESRIHATLLEYGRLRTRKQYFLQQQKKLMPTMKMRFKQLKRCVFSVDPLRFLFKLFGRNFTLVPSFPNGQLPLTASCCGSAFHTCQFPLIICHNNYEMRSGKIALGFHCMTLWRRLLQSYVVKTTHCCSFLFLFQQRIQSLMTKMTAMASEESRLTASSVGQIVGLCSAEIKQIVSEYAEKQSELSAEESPEKLGTSQLHRRKVMSLNKQILQKTKHLEELKSYSEKLDKEQAALEKIESKADPSILLNLRALVAMNENLKSQEQEFKAHCREEMTRLQQEIENLKAERVRHEKEDLDRRYNMEKEKLYKIRLLQARRNREIAILHRKIDEVPSRAELIQYQKRFIELYRQISAVHKETKQFFTLYNTLDDKKVYLEKEVRTVLCGSHTSADFSFRAMASPAARDQFLRQMEQIVEGIKQSRMKMEKKKQENKMRRDQLNDQYLELLEKQRLYFKTVKEFKEEGRKNEVLLSKVKAKAS
ncbi:Coiled-coil domain-containing protein 93 [Tupaia chinensis]|uniref:Coiled-coil domain-containing protein 93 n=1 Tax=Tupaia chinensis TaxID=246437 RepID=L8Y5M3_TUPCH|nr:Coiled-coil domain-containing protein 93 [Tupaia chinensis]